jgi:DNA mismatch repair protein MutL
MKDTYSRLLPPFAKGGAAGGGINILELQIELQYDIDSTLSAMGADRQGVVVAKIHLLAEQVFHKIAAGEVIERPLSAVKELVENAIDAGADTISVALRAGGKESIRVEDNGSGFAAADIEIAFQRHTTSKLTELEDLDRLQTLGFRGEALPSILEVADIDLVSSDNDLGQGWHCQFRNGRLQDKKGCACRRGSVITVSRLFADFPVRLKFMKSDQGELRPITAFLEVTALARPAIAFSLQHNGRSVFSYAAAADLRERIYQVFGNEFLDDLRAVDFSSGDFRLNGFISAAQTGISGKGRQFFVVNGRPVKEKTMMAAFNNTYQSYLEKSRSPAGVLDIIVPAGQIDVNIHPMKLEIRFLDSGRVYQFIKNAIESAMGQPAIPLAVTPGAFPPAADLSQPGGEKAAGGSAAFVFQGPETSRGDDFRVLGQYQNSYIVIEKNGSLLIVDQHNARERVLFERLQAGYEAGNITSAQALFPLLLELSPAERQALDENKQAFFKKSGFDVRPLSGAAVEIKAFPQFLAEAEIKETLRAALQQPPGDDLPAEERMLAAMACRNAVKVNQRLQPEQQYALVRDLFACKNPYLCPHRRPIIVTLTLADIEKQLKRR